MTRTLQIDGMRCGHCEARVKKTLEAIPGVEQVQVNHIAGTAVVTVDGVSDDVLSAAVAEQGYPVLNIG